MASPSGLPRTALSGYASAFHPRCVRYLGKAHVQHAVSFIENQRFHCAAVEVLFFYVLQQTACRRDNDIWFSLNTSAWFIYATPPVMVAISRWVFAASSRACSATCIASSRVGVRIKMRGGPDFYAESRANAATQAASRLLSSRAGWRRTEHIAALKRRRNGRGLNGGRACKAFALKGIEQAFIEFKFGKSRYSHVLPLCGALIIDVTAVIFICLYGYRFSTTSLSPMLLQFHSEGCPDMSQLKAQLRRDGFTFKQFLWRTIVVR